MQELFEEAMKVVLGRIRPNNTGDDALKFTQAAYNLAQARNAFVTTRTNQEPTTNNKSGAGATK